METLQKKSVQQQSTILHITITGLNDWSDNSVLENLTLLLNRCFEMIKSVVSLYQGSVEEYSGVGITAVFGNPDFTEKTPFNAVCAAIELRNKIAEINKDMELQVPINIKIGIQSGTVLVGKIGDDSVMRNTVLGETVTIASRICDIAEDGQVLTGQEVFDKTKDKFDFLILEPVPIKGKRKPLPLFEVKGRKKSTVSIGKKSGRMIHSDMVGREIEFDQLQKQIMQLINGRGSVVNIVGKAGMGKSRLMVEIRKRELLQRVTVFEGRALSNGQNLSFHPIIQIIKSWAGIMEENSMEVAKRKLESNIKRIYPEVFDEIFPFIATMMGYRLDGKAKERIVGIEGEALENLILKNIRDLLSRAASIRPIVIVIEDAHWCDMSSIIFMESLYKLVQKQRILFVTVFRPGYKETSERIQDFVNENLKDHHLEINIKPLTKDESDALIDNLLKKSELPNEINTLIIERASGNPFFIEELIRSFIDEGLIKIKDKQFLLTENIKYANIPESINNILLSRIDRLDGKTKELLKTASVIGRNFYFKVLEEAVQNIEEVDNKLEYLKDVQLINERKQKDEVEFLFKHALAQQATYDSILEKTRKDLHLKIANSIEKVFTGRIHEFYGTLVHHYTKAGQKDKIEEYLLKAGDESMRTGASSEAVIFFKKALQIIQQHNTYDRKMIVDLEEKLAFTLSVTGQHMDSLKYCDNIVAYYYKSFPKSNLRRLIDFVVNILLLYRIIYFYKYNPIAKSNEVNQKLQKVFVIISKSSAFVDTRKLFFDPLYWLRFVNRKQLGNNEALIIMSYSSVFFHTGILFNLGKKLVNWGKIFIDEEFPFEWTRGKFCIAMQDYDVGNKTDITDDEKVIKYAIQNSDFFYSANYYYFCSMGMIERGDEKQTVHLLNRILQISETLDSNSSLAQYHRMNITYNLKFRKLDEVIRISDEVLDFLKKNNLTYVLIALYSYRCIAYSIQQDMTEARKLLLQSKKLVKTLKIITLVNIYLIAKTYIEIAELRQSFDKGLAREVLNTTKELINKAQKVRKNLTEAYRLRAIIFWLINKPNKALRNFNKSINAGLSYDCNLELSRTYFEAGKFLSNPENKKERIDGMSGTECLIKSKSMFEEMNLQWDLQEYKKYIEGKE